MNNSNPPEPSHMTLDQLIDRLVTIRAIHEDEVGDYHVHFCTEHAALKGTQLQEPIKDIAMSEREGTVILLGLSFK